jgi:methylenetetrahydrofolate dehydrogenase (NADP+) / methenyltetrahydrofolate cyclohydrolase
MAIVFDGRDFAAQKEEALKLRVLGLKTRGVHPHLASILIGHDPASELYVNLKKIAATRIGAELDIYFLPERVKKEEVVALIDSLNNDNNFQGIMIQMPLPGKLEQESKNIINLINPEKDVDGLREKSDYLHPTSKAVIDILHFAEKETLLKERPSKVAVVGATGMVGKPLVEELKLQSYRVIECNTKTKDLKAETLSADVIVSTTGVQGIIKEDMVKPDAIVIDVGSPKGDVNFYEVERKAAFITPVPGGVGPVTISCLLENLISAC